METSRENLHAFIEFSIFIDNILFPQFLNSIVLYRLLHPEVLHGSYGFGK